MRIRTVACNTSPRRSKALHAFPNDRDSRGLRESARPACAARATSGSATGHLLPTRSRKAATPGRGRPPSRRGACTGTCRTPAPRRRGSRTTAGRAGRAPGWRPRTRHRRCAGAGGARAGRRPRGRGPPRHSQMQHAPIAGQGGSSGSSIVRTPLASNSETRAFSAATTRSPPGDGTPAPPTAQTRCDRPELTAAAAGSGARPSDSGRAFRSPRPRGVTARRDRRSGRADAGAVGAGEVRVRARPALQRLLPQQPDGGGRRRVDPALRAAGVAWFEAQMTRALALLGCEVLGRM